MEQFARDNKSSFRPHCKTIPEIARMLGKAVKTRYCPATVSAAAFPFVKRGGRTPVRHLRYKEIATH